MMAPAFAVMDGQGQHVRTCQHSRLCQHCNMLLQLADSLESASHQDYLEVAPGLSLSQAGDCTFSLQRMQVNLISVAGPGRLCFDCPR